MKIPRILGRGTFTGTLRPKKFRVVKGRLEATGKLAGKLVNASGTPAGRVSRTITTTVRTPKAARPRPARRWPAAS